MIDQNDTGADEVVVVVPPAPGDVEADIAERAYRRSMTLAGGFSLESVRSAALDAMGPEEHLPFPLVRRRPC
jgi:hypothetical protein